ncbi:GlxA family transcriptional regulator [Chitinophaga sp. Ak27]|uniref:GlxA family transcriptional regulator n=1 Tax=Chitinophaga sp. Ak27 TaxID=2726116 RepID=UPI00145D40D2|nr:DJ-1/PfpI family protein [Chitinophaga sp. Ak27]NLU95948.1 helix-turn-helix domain-containing protein [Chitinophaga sp. Ak27]
MTKKKVVFILLPQVELLDLAGPAQVFIEARHQGLAADVIFCGFHQPVSSAAGLILAPALHYSDLILDTDDIIFLPGIHAETLSREPAAEKAFLEWLRSQVQKGVLICSVCNAAFVLAEAGLLDQRECTTHWRSVKMLQQLYPATKVLTDVLFVKSERIYTSAGVSSGIDLALFVLEEWKGALFAHHVARGLVVYHRRNADHSQQSIYLAYRNHIRAEIHRVQDYMIEHLHTDCDLDTLADIAVMSPRNLARVFKTQTGITVHQYLTALRIEKAHTLRKNPAHTMAYIASQCGFRSARQLQRILLS